MTRAWRLPRRTRTRHRSARHRSFIIEQLRELIPKRGKVDPVHPKVRRDLKKTLSKTPVTAMSDAVRGSGHPSLHGDGRYVVTDTYLHESLAYGAGTTPIRWLPT